MATLLDLTLGERWLRPLRLRLLRLRLRLALSRLALLLPLGPRPRLRRRLESLRLLERELGESHRRLRLPG